MQLDIMEENPHHFYIVCEAYKGKGNFVVPNFLFFPWNCFGELNSIISMGTISKIFGPK